jgi:membrane-bound serine protease (ClpP class)
MAGHVAAMAPATNIGAAHPVSASGGDIEGDLRAKAENDAVATIRKIATERGRNADWAERAVRYGESLSSQRAVEMDVIDLIATDQAGAATSRSQVARSRIGSHSPWPTI